jgi:hypothetical protein
LALEPLWRVVRERFGSSGALVGAALTNIQTIFKNLRNNVEVFAVNQNLLPGATQVAW